MNRLLLDQLQQMRSYPSITILMNTTPGATLSVDEQATARRLAQSARERLCGHTENEVARLVNHTHELIEERTQQRSGHALAICVSPGFHVAVSLGGTVDERVVIDETFATRDLVADLNRTAVYRVITVSDSIIHTYIGDRQRIIEDRTDTWPLQRDEDLSNTVWGQRVTDTVNELNATHALPTVLAGVDRSITKLLDTTGLELIGRIAGNHDRTGPTKLHTLVWPIVLDWTALQQSRALEQLDQARSSKRYAAGAQEIWPLAGEGRVELVVVEDDYYLSARIDHNGQLAPTNDDHRDVTDDVVDEIIEAVLRNGGRATMVDTCTLEQHGRVAAVLRY